MQRNELMQLQHCTRPVPCHSEYILFRDIEGRKRCHIHVRVPRRFSLTMTSVVNITCAMGRPLTRVGYNTVRVCVAVMAALPVRVGYIRHLRVGFQQRSSAYPSTVSNFPFSSLGADFRTNPLGSFSDRQERGRHRVPLVFPHKTKLTMTIPSYAFSRLTIPIRYSHQDILTDYLTLLTLALPFRRRASCHRITSCTTSRRTGTPKTLGSRVLVDTIDPSVQDNTSTSVSVLAYRKACVSSSIPVFVTRVCASSKGASVCSRAAASASVVGSIQQVKMAPLCRP